MRRAGKVTSRFERRPYEGKDHPSRIACLFYKRPEATALLRSQKRSGEYVFKEETNQKVNVVLKRWCKEARIKKPVSFHSARHTFCVLLLTKDVPIYTVQQLMCHSDIGTTKVYADLLNKTKSKAVRKMPYILA